MPIIKAESFWAWAIRTNDEKNNSLIGRYWMFRKGQCNYPPKHLEGCRVALFMTRAIAREYLLAVKSTYPKATVIKVAVLIDER